jgi:hypothetical protein
MEVVWRIVRTFSSVEYVTCHENNVPIYPLSMTLNKLITQAQKTLDFQCYMNRMGKAAVEAVWRMIGTFSSVEYVSCYGNNLPRTEPMAIGLRIFMYQ